LKRLIGLFAVAAGILAFCRPAAAAELKVIEPADRTLVKGTVQFRLQPKHDATDMFLTNPEISIQDEYGKELQKFRAARDIRTQLCSAVFDTTKVPDGIYLVTIIYPTLLKGQIKQEVREDLTLGVRNSTRLPERFTVELAQPETKAGEFSDITVKVFDKYKRPMPGARVSFKVDKGELDTDAEITDGDGEAIASIDSDDAQMITLTISVENLPAVTKTIKFVSGD
jgi:hypothetical protein